MSTPTSPYQTFSDIFTAVVNDAKESTSTQIVSLVKRWINEGQEQVTFRKKRDWLDSQITVQVNAAVQETCTVTNGSPIVTFTTGTTFPAGVELQFQNQGYEEVYNVSSATLNVVTLANPYQGETNTAASGIIFQPHVILDPSIRHIYQAYHQHTAQPLVDLGPQQMRALQENGGVQLEYSRWFSIFGQDSAGARRLVLYPYPFYDYTLYLDVNTFAQTLVNDADEPAIPIQYRQILYWYGIYRLWLYHRNDNQAAQALQNFNSMLQRMDGEMRAEIEFPQLIVSYPRRKSLRNFAPLFDPRIRDNS